MSIDIWFIVGILLIVWFHWIGDFVMQLDRMALNKSKSQSALFEHIYYYSTAIFIGALIIFKFDFVSAGLYAVINGILHFYTDYVTSRWASKLKKEGKMGSDKFPNFGFFAVIGLDQAIHMTCLLVTYYIMVVQL